MARYRFRALRRLGAAVACGAAIAAAGWVAFYVAILRDLPNLEGVEDYRPRLTTRVTDRGGRPIGEFFEERRRLTPIDELPPQMIDAIVAAEDASFFEHRGLDYSSMLRAAWVNLWAGRTRQGASTITQQVAKSLLLTPERSYRRKLRDMILAHRIEQRLTKREILYLYLNQIYFGHGAYGIADAALAYFGKPAAELSASECALLAGLPQRPSEYSPLVNPDAAERRRRYVLRRMREVGYLDAAAHEEALAELPVLDPLRREDFPVAAYFTEEVRRYLFERLGSDAVLHGGLTIETTLDIELQRAAVAALRSGLVALDRRQGYRGPERRVARAAIPETLLELSERNALEPAEEGAAVPLPADRQLVGVVTQVDRSSQSALVAFAPGVEATVLLEDVSWARVPDPSKRPRPVKSIERVFRVGDLASFRVREPMADEPAEEGAPPRVVIAQEPLAQGALLSLDVGTGDVLALVGGYDFKESEFNRALQALRQPGSAFKPIIYSAALARDYTPVSILWDRPFVATGTHSGVDWKPRNYGRKFLGQITLREALTRSVNNATIYLADDLGISAVIEQARRLGIESELARDLSLALGSSSLSLLELVRAFATFPAQGRLLRPRFITRVLDRDGEVLLEDVALGDSPVVEEAAEALADGEGDDAAPVEDIEDSEGPGEELLVAAEESADAFALDDEPLPGSLDFVPPGHVISPSLAYLMTDLLRGVVVDPRGTGRRARVLGNPVGGKTGTTNEQADAWFIGFSADVATGVWVGFDEKRVLGRGEAGSVAALPIWIDFMRVALADRPNRDFPVPPEIVFARIDRGTGLLADATSQDTYFQPFHSGSEPTRTAAQALATSESDRLLRLDF